VSFCAVDSADGSNKGRRPPNVSVCADTVEFPIIRQFGVNSAKYKLVAFISLVLTSLPQPEIANPLFVQTFY
jgi:hypothetical protein